MSQLSLLIRKIICQAVNNGKVKFTHNPPVKCSELSVPTGITTDLTDVSFNMTEVTSLKTAVICAHQVHFLIPPSGTTLRNNRGEKTRKDGPDMNQGKTCNKTVRKRNYNVVQNSSSKKKKKGHKNVKD